MSLHFDLSQKERLAYIKFTGSLYYNIPNLSFAICCKLGKSIGKERYWWTFSEINPLLESNTIESQKPCSHSDLANDFQYPDTVLSPATLKGTPLCHNVTRVST